MTRTLVWNCGSGTITATTDLYGTISDVVVTCGDPRHEVLAELPKTKLTQLRLLDDQSNEIAEIPSRLRGAIVAIDIDVPAECFVRVEAALDPETGLARATEEFKVGNLEPGPHRLKVPLYVDAAGPNAGGLGAQYEVQISLHLLDRTTAENDWGDKGICLAERTYRVAKIKS